MVQKILLAIVFAVALFYLGWYIYRQLKVGGKDGKCDKCLPGEVAKNRKSHS